MSGFILRSFSAPGSWADEELGRIIPLPGSPDAAPEPALEDAIVPAAAAPAAPAVQRTREEIDAELGPIKDEIARIQRDEQKPLLNEIKGILAGKASLRGADKVNSLLEAVKRKIINLQKLQSPLLRERAAAALAAAPAAAPAPPAVPFVFNLEVPVAQPRTMLYIIGAQGERHPTQKKWLEQWRLALSQVQALPREQYSPAFAQIKKQFEDQRCRFEKRHIEPRGNAHA